MAENKQARNYLEMKIKTATPIQLVIMLYDKAISSLNSADKILNSENIQYDEVNNKILKAQEIVSELMLSLDFDRGKEIAKNLYSLYEYIIKLCIDGNIKKDSSKLQEASKILDSLRDGWKEIAKKEDKPNNQRKGGSFNMSV